MRLSQARPDEETQVERAKNEENSFWLGRATGEIATSKLSRIHGKLLSKVDGEHSHGTHGQLRVGC